MARRCLLSSALLAGLTLLACSSDGPMDGGGEDGGGGGGGGGGTTLEPAEFNASVNPAPPAGYTISGEQPYEWRTYLRYNGAWVAVGSPQRSSGPSIHLVVDCDDPEIHHACSLHLSGLIQVVVTEVSPGPALLCAYKSGFDYFDGLLLNTPLGSLGVAPLDSSSQDPANEGICYP